LEETYCEASSSFGEYFLQYGVGILMIMTEEDAEWLYKSDGIFKLNILCDWGGIYGILKDMMLRNSKLFWLIKFFTNERGNIDQCQDSTFLLIQS